jgi:8-oxo-dGTP diphosphatase
MSEMNGRIVEAASALLVSRAGQVLLQLRDDKPDIPFPRMWTFFGGAVEEGETHEQAVHREVQEELGLTGLTLRHWTVQVRPAVGRPDLTVHNHIYVGRLMANPADLTLGEGLAMALFDREAAQMLELAFWQHEPLRRFFAELDAGVLEIPEP